jgi:hypothetical protein
VETNQLELLQINLWNILFHNNLMEFFFLCFPFLLSRFASVNRTWFVSTVIQSLVVRLSFTFLFSANWIHLKKMSSPCLVPHPIYQEEASMKPTFAKWFAVALLAMLFAGTSTLLAQGVTTAAITGKVTSSTGEVLPGANVIAVHNPSGSTYGTSSRVDGRFDLPGLRVGGPYTITVSFVGYAQQKKENITLQLSQTMTLNFLMSEAAVQLGAVEVIGERNAILSAARTGSATNVVRTTMDRLPTITRNFQDYYKTSPYFTGSNEKSSSVAGRNSKYNNVQIDGADFNDMFGLGSSGTPGGQSGTPVTPISLDAIEEFQVVVSPFDVRQAGFTGAGINAITRSGTNELRGSAFYNGRNQSLVGVSPDALQANAPDFTQYSTGFRLGGPIIQNKLFFFVNGELVRQNAPFTRTFNNDKPGANAFTVFNDSLNILSNTLQTKYGYSTGSWTTIPQIDNSEKFFLRFDFNLSQNHKLTARWNYLNAVDDNSPSRFRGTTDIYSENARYVLKNKTNSFGLQLTSLFGNVASNEVIVGYNDQGDKPVYYGQPFPTLDISTYGSGSDKTAERLAAGSEEFRHYNELGQKHIEITDNFTYYLQGHTLTAGVKFDMFKIRNLFIQDAFGFYQYNSLKDFLDGKAPASYAFRYSATSNPLQEANWGMNQFGIYAQDEWTVSPTLKITAGVRFDIPQYTDKPNYNRAFDSTFTARGYSLSTDKLPNSYVAASPRIGFNWAIDEERNNQLRGGVGIFSGRFPFVWVSNQYSNTGVDFYSVTTAPSGFIADPNGQPRIAKGLPSAEVDITDQNFKAPSILRTNLAWDHRLPFDIVASVEAIFSWTQNDVYYQNINLSGVQSNNGITPNGIITAENRQVWGTISATTGKYSTTGVKVNSNFTAAYLVKNTNQGSNSNITVQLQRQNPSDGLIANLAYTWGVSKDVGGTNSTTASSGWRFNPTQGDPNTPPLTYSDYDRRHRVLATASYRFDWSKWIAPNMAGWGTTVGLFYNGLSGTPFSYLVLGDINGDGNGGSLSSINDLAYIPKDANDIILVSSAGAVLPKTDPAYQQLMDFIENDSYLKEHKGQIAERNGARTPWFGEVDLRISQDIPTISGQRVEVFFDVLNVMNLLNNKWGWQKWVGTNNTTPLYSFNSFDVNPASPGYGKPRYVWTNPADPNVPNDTGARPSRWAAQFGVRYTF